MKESLVKLFPYLLVTSYSILCIFRVPTLPDSIILLGFLGYLCYHKFMVTKEQPDLRKEVVHEMNKLRNEITEIQSTVNQMSTAAKGTLNNGRFKF